MGCYQVMTALDITPVINLNKYFDQSNSVAQELLNLALKITNKKLDSQKH